VPRIKVPGAPPAQHRATSGDITADYPIVRRTLYAWAAEGKIHVWKLGSKNIYDRPEIESLIRPQRRSA
jgi:predicted site-specific integrase-resolvase